MAGVGCEDGFGFFAGVVTKRVIIATTRANQIQMTNFRTPKNLLYASSFSRIITRCLILKIMKTVIAPIMINGINALSFIIDAER